MYTTLLNKLKSKIFSIKKYLRKVIGYPVIYNASNVSEIAKRKRALLIYLVQPFLINDSDPKIFRHTNQRRSKLIAELLNEWGYVVDVADLNDNKLKLSYRYDLIISHKLDDDSVKDCLTKNGKIIFLATGMNRSSFNLNMQKRYDAFEKRRKNNTVIFQKKDEKFPLLDYADAIIAVGNNFTTNSWKIVFKGPIYPINNFAFKEIMFNSKHKIYEEVNSNFLFFASGPQIGKGLDLLLEIFPKHPTLKLYICSNFKNESDFCEIYQKELYHTPNIHSVGRIAVNSKHFYELVDDCTYVILPSCTEGQAGSVVVCMYSGLIPVVTKESGIDTEDFGITLKDDSIETLEKSILALSQKTSQWCETHSKKTRKASEDKFSEMAFKNRLEIIFNEMKIN